MLRPTFLTVIAWLIIVPPKTETMLSLYALLDPAIYTWVLQRLSSMTISAQVMFMVLQVVLPVLPIVCGIFLLRGANWARILYLVSGSISVIMVWTRFHSIIWVAPEALKFVVFAFLLTRPAANKYFAAD